MPSQIRHTSHSFTNDFLTLPPLCFLVPRISPFLFCFSFQKRNSQCNTQCVHYRNHSTAFQSFAICSLLSFSFPRYSFFTIIDSIFFVLFLFERLSFISLLCSLAGPCSRYIISYVVVRTCRDVYVSSTSMTSLSFMALQFDRSGWKVGRIVERQRSSCH